MKAKVIELTDDERDILKQLLDWFYPVSQDEQVVALKRKFKETQASPEIDYSGGNRG